MAIRQMSEIEIQAIADFLDESEETTVGIDSSILRIYIEHQKSMLRILDKFKKKHLKKLLPLRMVDL